MLLEHRTTGERICFSIDKVSRSKWRLEKSLRALERYALAEGLSVYFVTLTLRSEDVWICNKDLNKFFTFVRTRFKRLDVKILYSWVVELQRRRYVSSGIAALHWHIAICAPDGSFPNVAKVGSGIQVMEEGLVVKFADLEKGWGHGFVFSCRARVSLAAYLSKYFTKDYGSLEGYNSQWRRLRRFGSSMLGIYGLPAWAFEEVSALIEGLEDWAIRRRNGVIELFYKIAGEWADEVVELRSPWRVLFSEPLVVRSSY